MTSVKRVRIVYTTALAGITLIVATSIPHIKTFFAKLFKLKQSHSVKTPSESRCEFVETLNPVQCSALNICYGGELLAMIDKVAGACAFRHSGGTAVTASISAFHFWKPARLSDIVIMHAQINEAFSSSMEVGVRVAIENPLTGNREFICDALLTFVGLDSSHRPRHVPSLHAESSDERRAQRQAQQRRQLRNKGRIQASDVEETWAAYISQQPLPSDDKNMSTKPNLSCDETHTEMNQIVMPQHANPLGITFGGQVVKWMEQVASISAMRTARQAVVTVGVDSIKFLKSSNIGDVLRMHAQVNRVFTTSMEVGVRVESWSANQSSSNGSHVNSGYFTFVSLADIGQSAPVGRYVLPSKANDRKRYMEAEHRRKARMRQRSKSLDIRDEIKSPQQ